MTKQSQFLESLALSVATGSTVRLAAIEAKCSESQAYRISRSVECQERVFEIRTEITCQAVGRLSGAAVSAVDCLIALLSAEEPRDRLAAAKAILSALQPMSEFGELRQRIAALENDSLRLRIAQ